MEKKELRRLAIRIDVLKEKLAELEKQWDEALDVELRHRTNQEAIAKESSIRAEIERTKQKLRETEALYNHGEGALSDEEVDTLVATFFPGKEGDGEEDDIVDALVATF